MRTRPLTVLLAALPVLVGSLLLTAPAPASAAERVVVVDITAAGVPSPLRVPVAGGDTVRVDFRSLAPYAVPHALTEQGTYSYRVGDGDSFVGRILLAAPAPGAVATGPGLTNPPTLRRYGLPTVLAAVLVAGVVSLLVRLLLAEPAARRRRPGLAGSTPLATAN